MPKGTSYFVFVLLTAFIVRWGLFLVIQTLTRTPAQRYGDGWEMTETKKTGTIVSAFHTPSDAVRHNVTSARNDA